jgi:hypothetical protein
MKKTDIARLVIFFLAGLGLYFYMSNAVAAQAPEPKPLPHMTPSESYKIWNAINRLEEPWYKKTILNPQDPAGQQPLVQLDRGQIPLAPLNQKKEAKLRMLVQDYTDLIPLVNALIAARKRGDWDNFLLYKEKIAEELRPIWLYVTQAETKEETQKRSMYNRFKNWLATWRQSAYDAMQRAYSYFFTASSSTQASAGTTVATATEDKQNVFLQEVLGQKIPAPKEESVSPAPVADKK